MELSSARSRCSGNSENQGRSVFGSLKSVDREGSRRMGLPSQTIGEATESGRAGR